MRRIKMKRVVAKELITLKITTSPEQWQDVLEVLGRNCSTLGERPHTIDFGNMLQKQLDPS